MESASANTKSREGAAIFGPGLGDTQLALLMSLKRLGATTQARIAAELPFAPATLREHLRSLTVRGLVERRGTQRSKRGRPEVVYALADRAESLFPRQEAQVLQDLVRFLLRDGHQATLERFFAERVAQRRPAALAEVKGRKGVARFHAAARFMSEQGFLALVGGTARQPVLRLCHCPIRDVVDVTRLPCRFEEELVAELLGSAITREEYIPDGQASCSYRCSTKSPTSRREFA